MKRVMRSSKAATVTLSKLSITKAIKTLSISLRIILARTILPLIKTERGTTEDNQIIESIFKRADSLMVGLLKQLHMIIDRSIKGMK